MTNWSQAWVETAYGELENDGGLREAEGRVRNASQVVHANEHEEWLKSFGLLSAPSAAQIWDEKSDRFPGLRFLPRVEKDLAMLEGSGAPFSQALAALEALVTDVAAWGPDSPRPVFSTLATPEYEQRKKLCWVTDDVTGKKELFDWHTRFTGGFEGRVHFRMDMANRSIVVAYIGAKLMREISG